MTMSLQSAAEVRAARIRPDGDAGSWTCPVDVRTAIRKKWDSGALLGPYAAGQGWEPLSIAIRGSSAREIGDRLAEVRRWAAEWAEAARGPLRVEYKQVGGRHFGVNSVPGRAWLDNYDDAWTLLGVQPEVRRLSGLIETARGTRLIPWLTSHPMRALRLANTWDSLLATVRWIERQQAPGMYLRQVDTPGVDTKFIERHKGVLAELLDAQLDPSRVNTAAPDFAGRYGFLRRPRYIRFRVPGGFRGFSELSARTEEFSAAPDGITCAYVIENEITYDSQSSTGCETTCHMPARCSWTVTPCCVTGITGPQSHPQTRWPWTASPLPRQPSTPTSPRTLTAGRFAWNKSGSGSPLSRRPLPTADQSRSLAMTRSSAVSVACWSWS